MTDTELRAAVSSLSSNFSRWAIGDDYDLGRAVETARPQDLGALVAAVDALPD
jgi:hypothetical protein